jgi:diguanylate cyclase (GGDEF)-like protein
MTTPAVIVVAVLALLLLAALAALFFDRRAHAARREAAEADRDLARTELDEEREHVSRLHQRLRHVEESAGSDRTALHEERQRRLRVDGARRAEREWSSELRRQVMELQRDHSVLGDDTGDVRELVLRVAVDLADAEKGLLLAQADEDADGDLDLVCYVGFDNDPEHSSVCQRFASEVMQRDETVREDDRSELEGEQSPADREIHNLVAIPVYIGDDFAGVVVCANREGGFEELDDEVLLALGDHAGTALHNSRLHGELRTSYLSTVQMLADAIEAKDPFLRAHSDEVSNYVAAVADSLGLPPRRREELVFASLLHDVGKIGISERILLKPGRLTPEERGVVELHPRIGYRIVEQVPALRSMTGAILHHHERYDGDGYPSGLRGEEIPLEARVVSVADCFAAMTSDRPYRERMSVEDACAELERCAGTQFDPRVVRLFVEQVRAQPPSEEGATSIAGAMDEPEVAVRRHGDEPVLGYGPVAATDNLTLLYSHRHLHETAAAQAERAAVQELPFGLVMLGLTGLDEVNRRDGYAAGDEELKAAARVVSRAADECGGTACRHGGARFGLVVPNVGLTEAEQLASRLAAELSEEARPARAVAAAWQPGESGDDVVRRARQALAAAGTPAPTA